MNLRHLFPAGVFLSACAPAQPSGNAPPLTTITTTTAPVTTPAPSTLHRAPVVVLNRTGLARLINPALPLSVGQHTIHGVAYCGAHDGNATTGRVIASLQLGTAPNCDHWGTPDATSIVASANGDEIAFSTTGTSAPALPSVAIEPIEVHVAQVKGGKVRLVAGAVRFMPNDVRIVYRLQRPAWGAGAAGPPDEAWWSQPGAEAAATQVARDAHDATTSAIAWPVEHLVPALNRFMLDGFAPDGGLALTKQQFAPNVSGTVRLKSIRAAVESGALAFTAGVNSQLSASSSQLISMPATVQARYVNDANRRLVFDAVAVTDDYDYACQPNDATCDVVNAQFKSIVQAAYAALEAKANDIRGTELIRRGSPIAFDASYAGKTWNVHYRVSMASLSAPGITIVLEEPGG